MTQPYFSWDEETGEALCLIQEGTNIFYGSALCAPDDADMKSEKTGCEIAYRRAYIAYLQKEKEKITYQCQGLRHYQSTLSNNKIADDKYMIQRLNKEIKNLKLQKADIECKIDLAKTSLREYINDKDEFYKYIRNKRQGKTV